MDIRFNCPRCGQHLSVEGIGAGMLVNCPSCKEQIESPHSTVPPPPVPVPAMPQATAQAPRGRIIAFFAIAVIMGVKENSPSAGQNPIKARVGLTDSAVAVTNLDVEAWPRVTVYINGTTLDGYKAVYNRAAVPNELILIPFTEFARGDRRFNPVERKVTQAMVWVEGHDAPRFSFQ